MSHWTDDRVIQLKELRAKGRSCAEIAREMGGVTRNGVIGKLNRLKISRPRLPAAPKGAPKRKREQPTNPFLRSRTTQPMPELREVEAESDPVKLVDVGPGRCLYPFGAPTADMLVCGAKKAHGSYCAQHGRVSYNGAPGDLKSIARFADWFNGLGRGKARAA